MMLLACFCLIFPLLLGRGFEANAIDPCSFVDCAKGYICSVDEYTGRTYCEPSCDTDNGGCDSDQTCILSTVECLTAPCEKTVQCVRNPCASVRCANGYSCEVDTFSGTAFCSPSCELNNGGCKENEKCSLIQVECFTTPCPPVIECLPV